MGYGTDYEGIEFDDNEEDINKTLSDFQKMLDYHELTKQEFFDLGNNHQKDLIWNYNKFGKSK